MPGIRYDRRTGLPLIYRDSQYASRGFKINQGQFTTNALIPKPKFLFFVKFVRPLGEQNPNTTRDIAELNRLSNTKDGIVFQVKTIDRPKFNLEVETLSQYNKKRIVQKKINYQPMTMTFHDDINDQVLSFWTEYFRFYYGDGNQIISGNWNNDIVTPDFNEGNGGIGWGYLGNFASRSPNRMHFLERIELFQFYGRYYTKIQFIHPKITMIDHDANDYSDGASGSGIVMQFEYEGVIYDTKKEAVGAGAEFGFDEADYRLLDEHFVASIPQQGGNRILRNIIDKIQRLGDFLPTRQTGNFGAAAISNRIVNESTTNISAGQRVLSGSGFSFGTGALGGARQNVNSLVDAASLTGNVPSPDLSQKETGVRTTINNFGTYSGTNPNQVLTDPPTINNTGIDSAKVAEAASVINSNVAQAEQDLGNGQSIAVDPTSLNKFSKSFGTAAALARNQGIVTSVAEYPDTITSTSGDANAVVNKLPNGNYQLTERGAAVMNALRTPNSALGVVH